MAAKTRNDQSRQALANGASHGATRRSPYASPRNGNCGNIPARFARAAGLRYVTDRSPGWRRRGAGKGFHYQTANGKAIHDLDDLQRIYTLAIPPAWTDVWICPHANGHLQATGRDARGRKQYRYHVKWRTVRDENKYSRLRAFAQALPCIHRRIARDLKRRGLPRAKVLATIVRLLETTLFRVGNEEYASQNNSIGLTTMRDRHARVVGSTIHFEFRGKSGIKHSLALQDEQLARLVKRCRDLPGYELFQYLDEDGRRRRVGSTDVNRYLREISGADFTAKDFRTWAGTRLAIEELRDHADTQSRTRNQRRVLLAVDAVARRLGNTRSVCRKCYIHPTVMDAFIDGSFAETLERAAQRQPPRGLSADEAVVLGFLEEQEVKSGSLRSGKRIVRPAACNGAR